MGRSSIAEKTSNILLTVFILMSSAVDHSACSSTGCNVNVKYSDSTLYGLNVTTQNSFTHIVEVYSKTCSENLDEVGPSWYRLEVINSTTKDLGSFKSQADYSGAILSEDQEIEFDGGEEPLALFDLPRRYEWKSKADYLPPKMCYRLVIRHGDTCAQVVTAHCEKELHQYLREKSEALASGSGELLTTESPQMSTDPASTKLDLSPSPEILAKIMYCILSNIRLNCTGDNIKPTCGTDHQWYRNVCTLRLYKCVYGINVQRDREEKHCEHPAPDPSSFSPYIPTPPPTEPPTSAFAPCVEQNQATAAAGYMVLTKCLTYQLYKPIACWKQRDRTYTQCSCINSRSGIPFGTNWVVNCDSTSPPPGLLPRRPLGHCGLA